ncbi:hypothetical protein PGT21_018106 [Puccinia graminis f. sp. tritici]|uniref:Uncharacterized protein n=1 Tax=Puccinia graminis f. sp. tritici TaxID=56615 RepID=A0A5B0NCF2_PUCGR|nr:hypothetical protein PGT21_018106 [Puccinia graminis f. sp. tritici]
MVAVCASRAGLQFRAGEITTKISSSLHVDASERPSIKRLTRKNAKKTSGLACRMVFSLQRLARSAHDLCARHIFSSPVALDHAG